MRRGKGMRVCVCACAALVRCDAGGVPRPHLLDGGESATQVGLQLGMELRMQALLDVLDELERPRIEARRAAPTRVEQIVESRVQSHTGRLERCNARLKRGDGALV